MTTIAFLNRKGGVGKTSCCHHLAGAYALAGQRVLLVDADPQASLTQGLLGTSAAIPAERSIVSAFAGWLDAREVVQTVPFPVRRGMPALGVELIAGHAAAAEHNSSRPDRAGDAQTALRDWLRPLAHRYDLVLVDCPPNLQLLSRAAIVAADGVVVPLQPEDYGAQGIAAVTREVAAVQAGLNPRVRLLGYLLTMVQRNSLHAAYAAKLREIHGRGVFAADVPRATALAEAVVARQPIGVWRPHGKPAAAIAAVADEVLDRAGVTTAWRAAA